MDWNQHEEDGFAGIVVEEDTVAEAGMAAAEEGSFVGSVAVEDTVVADAERSIALDIVEQEGNKAPEEGRHIGCTDDLVGTFLAHRLDRWY